MLRSHWIKIIALFCIVTLTTICYIPLTSFAITEETDLTFYNSTTFGHWWTISKDEESEPYPDSPSDGFVSSEYSYTPGVTEKPVFPLNLTNFVPESGKLYSIAPYFSWSCQSPSLVAGDYVSLECLYVFDHVSLLYDLDLSAYSENLNITYYDTNFKSFTLPDYYIQEFKSGVFTPDPLGGVSEVYFSLNVSFEIPVDIYAIGVTYRAESVGFVFSVDETDDFAVQVRKFYINGMPGTTWADRENARIKAELDDLNEQKDSLSSDFDSLNKPDVDLDSIDPFDYVSPSDVALYGSVLGSIFDFEFFAAVIFMVFIFGCIGYVLFGKR